jgi:hypothetical protein
MMVDRAGVSTPRYTGRGPPAPGRDEETLGWAVLRYCTTFAAIDVRASPAHRRANRFSLSNNDWFYRPYARRIHLGAPNRSVASFLSGECGYVSCATRVDQVLECGSIALCGHFDPRR